jgi:hypothetical protein
MFAVRKGKEDTAMDYTAEIDRLRKQMQFPQKANSLLLVERNVAKLKDEKAGIIEMLRLARAADVEAGLIQPSSSTNKLRQQVDELERKLTAARSDLVSAREEYSAELAKSLAPTADAYTALMQDIIDVLERASALGVSVAHHAAANGLTCEAPHIRNGVVVSALVRDLRLAASGAVR